MKSFTGFAAFAAEFAIAAFEVEELNHEMLEEAGKIIERTAKKKIGEYQEQAGQFVAWQELAESTKQDRVAQGYTENDPGMRSGEMRDSIEHQATSTEAHVGSDNDKLVWFDQGTVKQPPRSVLGGSAFEKAGEIVEMIGINTTLHLSGATILGGKLVIERG